MSQEIPKVAKHGEKTIELRVRLWTNGLSGEPGKILPKHALAKGFVRVLRNAAHGLDGDVKKHFKSMDQLSQAMEAALAEAGITLHSRR